MVTATNNRQGYVLVALPQQEATDRALPKHSRPVQMERGDMAIVRVRKDVTLLMERGDMAIVRVRKDVTLLMERGDMAIVRVRKDVRLLMERGDMAIVRVRKDVAIVKVRKIHDVEGK